MEKFLLTEFNSAYKEELNKWQDKEKANGLNGLSKFVVLKGFLLGDYLEFINEEMEDMSCRLAFDEK